MQENLQPLIDLLPESIRPYWWAVFGLAGLFVILIVLGLVGGLFRRIFGRRKAPPEDWGKKLREDLSTYPTPPASAGKQRLKI